MLTGSVLASPPQWEIEGLPAALDFVAAIRLPSEPEAAASVLLHELENSGYPLAEVRVQKNSLIVTFGRISNIRVLNLEGKGSTLVHRYLETIRGSSPTADQWSHLVALINDIPGVEVSVGIHRLDDDGNYEALVEGTERRQSGALSFRNTPTKDFAEKTASLHQEVYALVTGGDVLRLEAIGTDSSSGSDGYFVGMSYQRPVDIEGTFAEFRVSHFGAGSQTTFQPGTTEDSKMTSAALVLGRAFTRFIGFIRDGYIELDYRAENHGDIGSADYGIARVSWFESQHDGIGNSFSYGLTLSGGSDVSAPDREFASLRGSIGIIGWLPMVSDSSEFRIETSGQIGTSRLPGFEQFSFDGSDRQRAFSPFEYSGNNGIDISLEVANSFYPWGATAPRFLPYAFLDASYIRNPSAQVSTLRPKQNELVSLGGGIKFSFGGGYSVNSWIAVPIHDGQRSDRARTPEFYLQGQLTW